MSIHIFIEYHGIRSPFSIQKWCRLGRMKQVISEALGIKISTLRHNHAGPEMYDLMIIDEDKYLQEECGVASGDIIIVDGQKVISLKKRDGMVEIKWVFQRETILDVSVAKTCTVRIMLDMVRQSKLFVPDTVKLYYRSRELTNLDAYLIDDIGIRDQYSLEIQGAYLPLALLSDCQTSISSQIDETCRICLKKVKSVNHIFTCGHINVCATCIKGYCKNKCPLCN